LFNGDGNILGNLNVQGNITFIDSNVIVTNDLYIALANNQSTYANINGAGLQVGNTGTNSLTNWTYNTSANAWTTNVGISATANISGGNILTAGLFSSIGNIYGGNVGISGNIDGGNILTVGLISSTGNIYSGNVNIGTGNLAGGNLSASGNVTATYFIGDGSYLTGIVPVIQSYLFANVVSNITPYYQAVSIDHFTPGTLASNATTVGTTATLIGEFITNPGYPNTNSVPPGQILARYETKKASGPRTYITYFTLVKRAANGTETVLLTSDLTSATAVNTTVQQATAALNTSTIQILTTDRLAVKIYAYTSATTDSITLSWGDNTDAGFDLPVAPPSITNFVPYDNATANVLLGQYGLSTSGNINANNVITSNTIINNGVSTSGNVNSNNVVVGNTLNFSNGANVAVYQVYNPSTGSLDTIFN
jgi:hypothetical protein